MTVARVVACIHLLKKFRMCPYAFKENDKRLNFRLFNIILLKSIEAENVVSIKYVKQTHGWQIPEHGRAM